MTDRQLEVEVSHKEWLKNPMTLNLRHLINKQEQKLIEVLTNAAVNQEVSDAVIRRLAIQVKTISDIKNDIFLTENFVNKSTIN